MRGYIRYILAFVGLFTFQVFVLNNVNIHGLIVPYVYVLFLLILPFQVPTWILLILGAGIGFSIDMFSGTPGMHMAASVAVAAVRPFVLQLITEKDYESNPTPNIYVFGYTWTILYVYLITLVHHIIYFSIESGTFTAYYRTLGRILLSSWVSALIMFLLLVLFQPSKRR